MSKSTQSEPASETLTGYQAEHTYAGSGARETAKPRTATRRRDFRYRPRLTVFTDYMPPGQLGDTVERAYYVGPVPNLDRLLSDTRDGELYLEGHYPVIKTPAATITSASSWFGDKPFTVGDAYHVWKTLGELLCNAWRAKIELLFTPATTGRDLWLRTIPRGVEYPVLSDELQRTIRAGAGQGRIEVLPGAGPVTLDEYDARLAYLSCTRGMPVGEPVELHGLAAYDWWWNNQYEPARLLVTFRVPDLWDRPGILPVAGTNGIGWTWPTAAGTLYGPTWCDSSELWLAHRFHWKFDIHRVIGWSQRANVFSIWQKRLLDVLAAGERTYAGDTTRRTMIRQSVRAIALFTIGSLHGAPHRVSGVGAAPPAGAKGIRYLPGSGLLAWHTERPAAWPETVHPEWSSCIWGRARARLLSAPRTTGALNLPADIRAVAFRTDAIYTDAETGWTDDGEIGRYVHKGTYELARWPANGTELLAAKVGARLL